jgi:hypothetical protein
LRKKPPRAPATRVADGAPPWHTEQHRRRTGGC